MGWGTFYKINLKINKKDINDVENINFSLNEIWNKLLCGVAMFPIEDKENPFNWVDKCNDFVREQRTLIENLYEKKLLVYDYADANEYHPEAINELDDEYDIDYHGYCSHIGKDVVEDELDSNKDIIENYWKDILVEVTASPAQKKDCEDNDMEWHEWCTFFINNCRREMEECYSLVHQLDQCVKAMKEDPESVVTE